jgi:hypothetical protein
MRITLWVVIGDTCPSEGHLWESLTGHVWIFDLFPKKSDTIPTSPKRKGRG